jgi:hypothetical protein
VTTGGNSLLIERVGRSKRVAKDKKKNKNKDKKTGKSGQAVKRLQSLAENPMVANIVASALVATAAAIKDPAKARKLAAQAGDQLTDLAKGGADRGNAMWQLALDIGRRALEEFGVKELPKTVRTVVSKAPPKAAPKGAPKTVRKAAPKTARKTAAKSAPKPASKTKATRSSRPKK